ncbi:hypothetical protein BASA81_004101 [Batrachochytrium salamandrivorans]|nr:hypothetical protein BASA81_004101 [Batrachochytrium salamandrivorans]
MQGKVVVQFHGEQVFEFTGLSGKGDSFPGNDTDSQFHTTLPPASAALDLSKYSCSYTGTHDHGKLPEQSRANPAHESTLRFLAQARLAAEEFFIQNK